MLLLQGKCSASAVSGCLISLGILLATVSHFTAVVVARQLRLWLVANACANNVLPFG
jgi:hypothetical protein